MAERFPEERRHPQVEAALGMLLMQLSAASRDTARAYYVDIYPEDPELPDGYTYEFSSYTPKQLRREDGPKAA